MTTSTRILCISLLAALSWAGPVASQQIVTSPGIKINDITADGNTVVGSGSGGAFYWNWRVDPAPTYIGGSWAAAISDDGSVIAGNIIDPVDGPVAATWTQANGWVSIGFLPNALNCPSRSSASDISADGTVVVGLSWDGCDGRGFRWTLATGMQALQALGNGQNACRKVSGDGQIMGGFAQGSFSRTPATWQTDLTGTMYNFNDLGEVGGINFDGTTIVGQYNGEAFLDVGAGPQLFGTLNAGWAARATGVAEDNSIICGEDTLGLAKDSWVWTSGSGIVRLNDVLTLLGVTGAPPLTACRAISADGDIVVGDYGAPGAPSGSGGYIVEFNSSAWVDLGGATAGALGQPLFEASGDLTAGSTLTLDLSNTQPNAIFLMWISLSSSPANVVGGTLYPLPADAKLVLAANPLGEFNIATAVAAGAPSGVDLWFQCLVQDATNIHGITLSNCMRGTTP
jgi:uncharacterized membrane protein